MLLLPEIFFRTKFTNNKDPIIEKKIYPCTTFLLKKMAHKSKRSVKDQQTFKIRLPLSYNSEDSDSEDDTKVEAFTEKCDACLANFWRIANATCDPNYRCCKHCNRSSELVYRQVSTMGNVFFGYRSNCDSCNKDIILPNINVGVKRCFKCDPSDKHHKYVLDNTYNVYLLKEIKYYDESSNKHYWVIPKYDQLNYNCNKCSQEDKTKELVKEYNKTKDKYIVKDYKIKGKDSVDFFPPSEIPASLPLMIEKYSGINADVGTIIVSYMGDITFQGTVLPHMNLAKMSAPYYILTSSIFSASYLRGANFKGANLIGTNFTGANMEDADLSHAFFTDAQMQGVNLKGAILVNTVMVGVNLIQAKLSKATLTDVNLTNSILYGASLRKATLLRVTMKCIDLSNTNLDRATITDCDMSHIVMKEGKYDKVTFEKVNLSSSSIRKCEFADSTFTSSIFNNCILHSTKMLGKTSFEGSIFSFTSMKKSTFVGANFNNTNFAPSTVKGSDFNKASFEGDYMILPSAFRFCKRNPWGKEGIATTSDTNQKSKSIKKSKASSKKSKLSSSEEKPKKSKSIKKSKKKIKD